MSEKDPDNSGADSGHTDSLPNTEEFSLVNGDNSFEKLETSGIKSGTDCSSSQQNGELGSDRGSAVKTPVDDRTSISDKGQNQDGTKWTSSEFSLDNAPENETISNIGSNKKCEMVPNRPCQSENIDTASHLHNQEVGMGKSRSGSIASSTGNDFSLINPLSDISDSEIDVKEIKEIAAGNNLESFKFIQNKDDMISLKRTQDSTSHQSTLGSSFVVLNNSGISSSYPSSFDMSVDPSKVQALPPKNNQSISVDELGNPKDKGKSIHGGLIEVKVHREDWKTNQSPSSLETKVGTGEKDLESNHHEAEDGQTSSDRSMAMENSLDQSQSSSSRGINTDNSQLENYVMVDQSKQELDSTPDNKEANQQTESKQTCKTKDKSPEKAMQETPGDESDYSVIEEHEVMNQDGKSDIDSDNISSHHTGPLSRCTSSESVEITMNQPEVDHSDGSDHSESKRRSDTDVSSTSKDSSSSEENQQEVEKRAGEKNIKQNQAPEKSYSEGNLDSKHPSGTNASSTRTSRDSESKSSEENHQEAVTKGEADDQSHRGSLEENSTTEKENIQDNRDGNGSFHNDTSFSLVDKEESFDKSMEIVQEEKFSISDVDIDGEQLGESKNQKENVDEERDDIANKKLEELKVNEDHDKVTSTDMNSYVHVKEVPGQSDEDDETSADNENQDVWQPAQDRQAQSTQEALLTEKLKRSHCLTLKRNVQLSTREKSYDGEMEQITIPVKNELVSAKWRYVLNRKKELDEHIHKHYPETNVSFDESYQQVIMLRYSPVVDEHAARQWSREVLTDIENLVRGVDSYLICCSGHEIKQITSQLEITSKDKRLDIDMVVCHQVSDIADSASDELGMIITGRCQEVSDLLLLVLQSSFTLYLSVEDRIVEQTICTYPFDKVQQDLFVNLDIKKSLMTQFQSAVFLLEDGILKCLIKSNDSKKLEHFIEEECLKYRFQSQLSFSELEFSLLLRSAVKEYIEKSLSEDQQYKMKFKPNSREIILYTDTKDDLDDIRATFFSCFKEHKITLQGNDEKDIDFQKSEKWKELVEDVEKKSKGTAIIDIDDGMKSITLIGTADIMKSWEAFGDIQSMEKFIDENICAVVPVGTVSTQRMKEIKRFLEVDKDKMEMFDKQKLAELQHKFDNVEVFKTDIGFHVIGPSESEVKDMCDLLLMESKGNRKPVFKTFVQMETSEVDELCEARYDEMQNKGKELDVEFEPTNMGFEVRGDKANVQKFCELLRLFKDTLKEDKNKPIVKIVKKFVQMEETIINQICDTRFEALKKSSEELGVEYDQTNLGFEVRGKTEDSVKSFCDLLVRYYREMKESDDQLMKDGPKPSIKLVKRFVQMEETIVSQIRHTRFEALKKSSEELGIEYDPTNLGFEVRGKTEDNVKTFCDLLVGYRREEKESGDKWVKSFLQMEETEIDFVMSRLSPDMDKTWQEFGVHFDRTNLGFEVKGKSQESVKKFCDYVLSLKSSIHEMTSNKFVALDSQIVKYIQRFKLIELDEIITNIEARYTIEDRGFDVVGSTEDNVNTLYRHILDLASRIETCKLMGVPKLNSIDLRNLEDQCKCIVKVIDAEQSDVSEEEDTEAVALWTLNGVKLSVTMEKMDDNHCDMMVKPVTPAHEGETRKRVTFHDKFGLDEVEMLVPLWADGMGKQKHELEEVLSQLLEELVTKGSTDVCYPISEFDGCPPVKVTKIFLSSLTQFLKKHALGEQTLFKKLILYSPDGKTCEKVMDAINDALPGLGLDSATVKKPPVWTSPEPPKESNETEIEGQPDVQSDQKESSQNAKVDAKSRNVKPQNTETKSSGMGLQDFDIKPKVKVILGEIAKQKVDAIVNTTSRDYKLENGAVSKSILQGAGPEIQKEMNRNCKKKKIGDLVVTKGYKLKCKSVFHGALESYDKTNQKGVKSLRTFVDNCLLEAHSLSYRTIALPVLGAGALEFPSKVVAEVVIDAVNDFRKRMTSSSLTTVTVVVYQDQSIYNTFKKIIELRTDKLLEELGLTPAVEIVESSNKPEVTVHEELPTPVKMVPQPVKPQLVPTLPGLSLDIGRVNLSAGLGDVTKMDGIDGLIMLWPKSELDSTPPDKENILRSGGPDSVSSWDNDKSVLTESKILVTPGGSLPQRRIIHAYIDQSEVQKAFELALTQADNDGLSSVVIPVRPTDQLAKDVKSFSTYIYRAVMKMQQKFQAIRVIRICIGGKHLYQPILATLAKLHETSGLRSDVTDSTETFTVEITALSDDLSSISAQIKPGSEEAAPVIEDEVTDKTLTKEEADQFCPLPKYAKINDARYGIMSFGHILVAFLLNANAEISPQVLEIIRKYNKVDIMKHDLGMMCTEMKVISDQWQIFGTPSQLQTCENYLQEVCANLVQGNMEKESDPEFISQGQTEEKDAINVIKVKVDITQELFDALQYLQRQALIDVIGKTSVKFLKESSMLEITGLNLPSNLPDKIKRIVSQLHSSLEMDMIELQYSQLMEASADKLVIKLQTEFPGVYMYVSEGSGAEASFQLFLVCLSREELRSTKNSIIAKFMKKSSRAGRFSKSIKDERPTKPDGHLTRSVSYKKKLPGEKMYKTAEGLIVKVYMASILQLKVDCIVNAANGQLLHGGGIAGVISKAAGPSLNKESQDFVKNYGQLQAGQCCATNAGNLPYKRIIHAVGPVYKRQKHDECYGKLQETIERTINLANKHRMKSVAIPSISAGLYGMPGELCARSYALGTIMASANGSGPWALKEVHFIDTIPDMVFKVQRAFDEHFTNSQTKGHSSIENLMVSSLDEVKGDQTTIEKLAKIQSWRNAGDALPDKKPEAQPAMTESKHEGLIISQPKAESYPPLPKTTYLPKAWKVTARINLMEINVAPSMKVLIYEQNLAQVFTTSIAFGANQNYRKTTLIKALNQLPDVKNRLEQLKSKLPNPSLGTVVMFQSLTEGSVQKVFVVITPEFPKGRDPDQLKRFHEELYECYLRLINQVASYSDVEQLAVAFLKTGNTGTSFEDGANTFFHAVNSYITSKDPRSKLREVHLILKSDSNAFRVVRSMLCQYYEGIGSFTHVQERVDKTALVKSVYVNDNSKEETEVKKTTNSQDQAEVKANGSPSEEAKVKAVAGPPINCVICLETIENDDSKQILERCQHVFHRDCINEHFRYKPSCPTCGKVYGVVTGNQPDGTMRVEHLKKVHLPGYKNCGQWIIYYDFPHGIQNKDHPNPGSPYRGTHRVAYLPANPKGTLVKDLLRVAFDRKLVFTIGHSRTTGEENVVTWNDIHHKTYRCGGAQQFGYPDPQYLDRVLEELAVKGVTETDLKK